MLGIYAVIALFAAGMAINRYRENENPAQETEPPPEQIELPPSGENDRDAMLEREAAVGADIPSQPRGGFRPRHIWWQHREERVREPYTTQSSFGNVPGDGLTVQYMKDRQGGNQPVVLDAPDPEATDRMTKGELFKLDAGKAGLFERFGNLRVRKLPELAEQRALPSKGDLTDNTVTGVEEVVDTRKKRRDIAGEVKGSISVQGPLTQEKQGENAKWVRDREQLMRAPLAQRAGGGNWANQITSVGETIAHNNRTFYGELAPRSEVISQGVYQPKDVSLSAMRESYDGNLKKKQESKSMPATANVPPGFHQQQHATSVGARIKDRTLDPLPGGFGDGRQNYNQRSFDLMTKPKKEYTVNTTPAVNVPSIPVPSRGVEHAL